MSTARWLWIGAWWGVAGLAGCPGAMGTGDVGFPGGPEDLLAEPGGADPGPADEAPGDSGDVPGAGDLAPLDPGTDALGLDDPRGPDPAPADPASADADRVEAAGPGDASDALDAGDPSADDGPIQVPAILVLTLNLKHPLLGLPDGEKRLEIVAGFIQERQPDLVALQEVVRPKGQPSFAERLAGMTGYEWVWEYTFTVPLLFDEGLGILSRWPVVWKGSKPLPHLDLVLFQRRVLGARLQSPHGEVPFFCTHMTTDSNETVKADQAFEVLEFIRDHEAPMPGFLAGDLNAEPHTLAMRFLRGEAEVHGVTGDLVDAWLAVHPDDKGYTMTSSKPEKRIDYIYAVPGTGGVAEPEACEVVLDEPIGGLYASDHLGVLCRFSLM